MGAGDIKREPILCLNSKLRLSLLPLVEDGLARSVLTLRKCRFENLKNIYLTQAYVKYGFIQPNKVNNI